MNNKKKAIKIATATAIAATGFVAVAPAQAATNTVDKSINNAITKMQAAYDSYNKPAVKGDLPAVKQVRTAVTTADTAYKAAVAEIKKNGGTTANKAKFTKKLNDKKFYLERAQKYVAATNINLRSAKDDLDAAVTEGTQSKVLKAKKALDAKIVTFEKAVAAVYGPKVRAVLNNTYTNPAKEKTASVDKELAVYAAYKKIQDGDLIAKDIEQAGQIIANTKATVEAISKKEGKLVANILKAVKVFDDKYEAALVPVVKEVSAINATQVEVKFNTPISKASLFTDGVSGAFKSTATVTLTSIDGVPAGGVTGTLSADGKTLTITSANALSKRYDVVVNGLKGLNDKDLTKYNKVNEFAADTTAPVVLSTTKKTASTFTVKFSEPMNNLGTASYKLADGTTVSTSGTGVTNDFAPGAQEVTFTIGTEVAAGKQVTATFVGAQDQALNLLNPNPATVSFAKGDKDGVAPTVTSLTAINNKTIEVKFSEELQANPTITGFTGTLTFKQDSTDKTKYTIVSNTINTGLKAVGVSAGYSDLSGETGAAYSKVINFDLDTVNPKVASSNVTTINGSEYLEVTFDEAVETEATLATVEVTGTKVSNYVTSDFTTVSVPVVKFVQDATNKKVYRIALTDLLGTNNTKGASYSLTLTGKTAAPATVALVNDVSGNVGPSSTKVSVTRNEDATSPSNTKATLDTTFDTNGIKANADKTITVRFNQELDGATATNVANYKFDGAVVEKAVLNAFGTPTGKQEVTLTFKDGSNNFTGLRNVTISGVKAKNGLAMDTVNTQEALTENVAPTVTSAKLTAPGVISLTFSEAVYNVADAAAGDFDLYVGGTKVAATTLDTEDVAKAGAKNTLTLTIGGTPLTADNLAKGLSIKPVAAETLDIKDANDNLLSVSSITVAQ